MRRTNWVYAISILLGGALLSGCAAVPVMPEEYDVSAEQFQPAAGKGNVYVVREAGIVGSAIAFKVDLDGQRLGSVGPGTYLLFELGEGQHVIAVKAENTDREVIEVVADNNYFVEVSPRWGVIAPRVSVERIDDERGQQLVIDGKRAEALPLTALQEPASEQPSSMLEGQTASAVDRIEFAHFSFARPEQKVWVMERRTENEVFFKSTQGKVRYEIRLLENYPRLQSLRHLSVESIADDYRNHEHQTMIDEGVNKGLYELHNLTKDQQLIGGKLFYTMKYSIQNPAQYPRPFYQSAELFLFFPDENQVDYFLVAHYSETAPTQELLTQSLRQDFFSILESVSGTVIDIRPADYDERVRQLAWKQLALDELDRDELSKKQADFFLAGNLVQCTEETGTSTFVAVKWFTKSKYLFLVDNKTKTVLTDETKKVEDCLIGKHKWTREGMNPWWLKMPQD